MVFEVGKKYKKKEMRDLMAGAKCPVDTDITLADRLALGERYVDPESFRPEGYSPPKFMQ